jgi:N-methylhydantoinase B
MQLKRGDVFCHIHPGGGGWGDPLERDPAAVLKDVRNEFVSAANAQMDYGVVIDTKAWTVDAAATERLRADMHMRRAWSEAPKVQWHDPDLPRSAAE